LRAHEERDRRKEKRDRQIKKALQIMAVYADPFRFKRLTAQIIKLLKPPPGQEFDCRYDIGRRLCLMMGIEYCVGHPNQRQTRKLVIDEYIDICQRLQIVNRRFIALGQDPPIAQDAADHMLEIAKCKAAWITAQPWFTRQVAVEQAYGLLQNWGPSVMVSRASAWHHVAAAILGVKNKDVALTRHMRKVHKVLETGGTAAIALTHRSRGNWYALPRDRL
jgi:hypothetical protein